MNTSYEAEAAKFSRDVEAEAARLVRDGLAAPFDAIERARKVVMERRQRKAQLEGTDGT